MTSSLRAFTKINWEIIVLRQPLICPSSNVPRPLRSRGPVAPWLQIPKGATALWPFQGGKVQEGREIGIPPLLALSLCGSTPIIFCVPREMGWNPTSALSGHYPTHDSGPIKSL